MKDEGAEAPPQRMQGVQRMHGGSGAEQQPQPHDVQQQQRDSEEERMWDLLWEGQQQEQEQQQVMAAAPGGAGAGGWSDVRRRLEAGGFSTVASLASLDEAQLDQLGVAHGPPRQRLLTHALLLRRLAASLLSSLPPLSPPAVLSPPLPSSSSSSNTNPGTMASSSFFSPLPPRRTHRGRGHQHHRRRQQQQQQQHEDDEPSDDDDDDDDEEEEEGKDAGHPSSSLALFELMSYGARRMLAGLERSGELPARTTTPHTSGHPAAAAAAAAERTHDLAAAAAEEEDAPSHDAQQQQQQQRAAAMEDLRARRMILQREFSFRAIKSLWLDAEACAARHRQEQHVQEQEQEQELLEAISAALGPGRGSSSPRPTPTAGAPSDGEAGGYGRTDGQQPLPRFNTNIAAAAAAVGGGGGDKEEGTRAAATGAHRQKKKKQKQSQTRTHKEPTTTKTTTAGESVESTDPDSQATTTTTPTTPTTKVVPKPAKTKLHKAPEKSRAGSAPCGGGGGGAPNASETREPRRRRRRRRGDANEENGEEAGEEAAASVMMASFLVLIDEVLALCQLVRNRAPAEVLADKAAFVEFMALKKRHFYFHPPPPPPPGHHHDSGDGDGDVGVVQDENDEDDDDEEIENGTTTGQEGGGQVPADQCQARCWQSGDIHLRGRGVRDYGELAHSGTQQQPRQHRPSSATTDAVGTAEEEEEEEEEDVGDAKFPYRKLVQRKDSMRGRGRLHDKRSRSLITLGSAIHRHHHHHHHHQQQQQQQHHHQHGRAGSSHSQDEDAMKSLSVEYNIRKTLTSSESWMLFFQAAQRRHSERASTDDAAAPAEAGSCGSSPEGGKGKLAKTKGAYLFISSSEVKKKRKSLDGLRRDHHLVTKLAVTAPTPARGHLAAPDHHQQQHGAGGEHQMALESGEVSASLALDDIAWPTHTEEGRIARELVYTEWTYERDLRLLYEEPLLRHCKEEGEGEEGEAAAGGARLTRDEVGHIFCHTRPLQGCSAALLQGLIAACRLPSPARNDAIGRCFLAHMATLEAAYRNHCSHYPLVVQTLKQLTTVRPGFAAFLEEVQMQPSSRRLRLLDFLIKPMQRLCKYPLLLAQLAEAAGAPEESLLRRAHSKIAEAVSSIDQAHQLMGLHALTDLYNRFVGGPPPELVAAGRRLVREGVVRVRKRDSKSIKRSDRVLLLFNDALVIAKEKRRDSREDEARKDNGDGDARRRMLRLKILLPLRLCVVANDYHKRGFTIHQSRDSAGESTTSHHHRPHSLVVVPSTDRLVFLVKETEERDQWVEDIRACAQACLHHHQGGGGA